MRAGQILRLAATKAAESAKGSGMESVQEIRAKALGHLRLLEEHMQQWPTSSLPDSEYTQYLQKQMKAVESTTDHATLDALRQHAHDMVLMHENLSRQKDIAMLLSGERAPPREMVRLAAARCGLSVPLTPEEIEAKRQEAAKKPSWQPELKGEFAERYGKKFEKKFGPSS